MINKNKIILVGLLNIGCIWDPTGLGELTLTGSSSDVTTTIDTSSSTSINSTSEESSTTENITGTSTDTGSSNTTESSTNTSNSSGIIPDVGNETGNNSVCGNGIIEFPEECDDAEIYLYCDPDCSKLECGDGYVNIIAGEECDDGNSKDNDTCSNDCISAKYVFVSNDVFFPSEMNGNPDAKCQELALKNEKLAKKTFISWTSDPTNGWAISRLNAEKFQGWYIFPNDESFVKGWIGKYPELPVEFHVNEYGNSLIGSSNTRVMTNTAYPGVIGLNNTHCLVWLSQDKKDYIMVGDLSVKIKWSFIDTPTCDNKYRIYCVEK